jgi:hypothetical protein
MAYVACILCLERVVRSHSDCRGSRLLDRGAEQASGWAGNALLSQRMLTACGVEQDRFAPLPSSIEAVLMRSVGITAGTLSTAPATLPARIPAQLMIDRTR